MKKKIFNIILMAGIFALTLIVPTIADADTSSPPYTAQVYGFTYNFTSEVWQRNSTSGYTVEAVNTINASANVPSGYMGGQARLYNTSGLLWTSSQMTYNTSKIGGFTVYSPRATHSSTYYSHSIAEFYNGNGYTKYTGYKSPNMTLSNSGFAAFDEKSYGESNNEYSTEVVDLMMEAEYEVNINGMTYGSGMSEFTIGEEPDLIAAIGVNGIEGYVKSDDLTPNITSIEEALEQAVANGDTSRIPLYAVDGVTIIGEFELVTFYE